MYGGFRWMRELDFAATQLPKLPSIMESLRKEPSRIYSADGQLLYQISAENRQPVRYDEIPEVVIKATLAAEDKRFFDHRGVDFWAIGRTLFTNVREGRMAQGASTLTMQLAKRVYTGSEKTFERKLRDMALAVMIERELTKRQILELYLNQVFYGSGAYGIAAAADVYFGKELSQLSVAEAALLARLVRRPSDENPFADLDRAIANRNLVLATMLEERMIDRTTYESALSEAPKLRKDRPSTQGFLVKRAPYFVDYVLRQLHDEDVPLDVSKGGYRIETTLDTRLQADAEKAARDIVRRTRGVTTAAFLLMDRDGRILAMVGGVDYERNQFNVVTQGLRQPGSSFKPFIYAAALEAGVLQPNSTLSNERFSWRDPYSGKVWTPANSSGRYGGSASLRTAIANSMNMPAIRAIEKVGPATAVQVCQNAFGFTSKLDPVMPLVLGASAVTPLEMAQGYSVFMREGYRVRPFAIRRVVGPDGEVVKVQGPTLTARVLSSDTAEAMDGFLRAVVTSGTARLASPVANARGKTGTTNDHRDAWFIGYTDRFLGVGWIAKEVRNSGSGPKWLYERMPGIYGGKVTVRMWTAVLTAAQKRLGEEARAVPDRHRSKRPADEPTDELPEEARPPDDGSEDLPDEGSDPWVLPPLDPPPGGAATP